MELGISKIILFKSEYSQRQNLNKERIRRALISALEQSNSTFFPEVNFEVITFNQLLNSLKECKQVVCFSLSFNDKGKYQERDVSFIVGPEGGLSKKEEESLRENEAILFKKIDTNIMKTPTAISCGFGYLLSEINN